MARAPSGKGRREDQLTTDEIVVAALARGLDLEGIRHMSIGQIVDICAEYNRFHGLDAKGSANQKPTPKRRKATQADWDRFFG